MNKGLKQYTKQLGQSIGKNVSVNVNLNKDDANMHITLPLIKTTGMNPIETGLIFNLQDKEIDGMFGKGMKLNYYGLVEESDNAITITNADGSKDEYLLSNGYENKETGITAKIITSGSYQNITYKYQFTDKYGNIINYDTDLEYPKTIQLKSGAKITTDFISAIKTISNGEGYIIEFIRDGSSLISKILYKFKQEELLCVELSYADGYLSELTYKRGTAVLAKTVLNITDSQIIVCDDISKYRIKYTIENNKVISFKNGYDAAYTNGLETTITYADRKTSVTDFKGDKTYIFFDDVGLPTIEMDKDGNAIKTEFDKTTKAITRQSSVILAGELGNLFRYDSVSDFESEYIYHEMSSKIDEPFSLVLGNYVDCLEGGEENQENTLTKRINVNGIAGDKITAVIWGRQKTPYSETKNVKVTLRCGNYDSDSTTFDKTIVDNNFDLKVLGVSPEKAYNFIELKITFKGTACIDLGGVKVLKKDFGSFYNYDQHGNLLNTTTSTGSASVSYNSDNMPISSLGINSCMYNFKYDDNGNLTDAKTAYGVNLKYTYDSEHKSNLTNCKISTADNSKIIEIKREYTDDGRFVSKEIDELGNETSKEYNSLGQVKKVINALNAITNFDFNDDGTAKKILLSKDLNSISAEYAYDERKRLSSVTLSSGNKYLFTYDAFNNLISVRINNIPIVKYTYDTKGHLIKQSSGNDRDEYRFDYNSEGLISKVTYVNEYNFRTEKFNYEYNSKHQLTKITDENSNIINEYIYDNEGNIKKVLTPTSSIENVHDNLGNVIFKKATVSGITINTSYDNVSRSIGSHPDSLFAKYMNNECLFASFEDDATLKYGNIAYPPAAGSTNATKEDIIGCVNINPNNPLAYLIPTKSYHVEESGCIQFWFKPTSSTENSSERYLFSTASTKNSGFIGVYLQGKKLKLKITDKFGNSKLLLTSDNNVDLSKWNFIALDFMNRDDGQGYDDDCEYSLTLNGHTQVFRQRNPRLYVEIAGYSLENIGNVPLYCFGHKRIGNTISNFLHCKIACLCIAPRKYLSLDDIQNYYRLSKDYLIDNQLVDSETKTVDFSQTNLFLVDNNLQDQFDIFPLQNSVTSLKNTMPIKFNIRKVSPIDKDRTFNFNKQIKRYAYVADGSELVYDFNQSSDGTILMRAFVDTDEEKQYFFEGVAEFYEKIGLFRNSNKKLCIEYCNEVIETNLVFTSNEWHTVGLSFRREAVSQSLPSAEQTAIRVILDNQTFYTARSNYLYRNFKIYIGRKCETESMNCSLGTNETAYPLFGQIEMLVASNTYCELETIQTLVEQLKGITKTHMFDELGMLRKTDIHQCGNSILSNTIEYQQGVEENHISRQIKSEAIKANGTLLTKRTYTADALGNVTQINDNQFGNHSYTYDYRGFLTNADGTTYNYDNNGNITKMGTKILTYHSTYKNRLQSVNNDAITYNSNSPWNPASWKQYSYKFEGRFLTRFTHSSGYYEYEYNDVGLRIKKKNHMGISTNYVYDGDKLISQISPSGRMDFLYDEYGNLYGFIENSTEKYFYVRDYMKNILGIVDKTSKLVVKYNYDAYGKCLSIMGDNSALGSRNPFRFKGYYYDTESGMYYCGTRYYVPEWGRWLNYGSIREVDFFNIKELNIYLYNTNNPVYIERRKDSHISSTTISTSSVIDFVQADNKEYASLSKIVYNWSNDSFSLPVWILTMLTGSDYGASFVPAFRTLYLINRYPFVRDLQKLYGFDYVPDGIAEICNILGYLLVGVNIVISGISNFTNDDLGTKQQWIGFAVDTTYNIGTFAVSSAVSAGFAAIPYVGTFIAPFAGAGVAILIDKSNEKWHWVDKIKQLINDIT